jgi:AMP phosphorylase
MEVLAPVSFDMDQVRKIVKKTHACLVWGGNLNLAPADDRIIRVLHPLSMESYDQMLVSIMAKKVAMGIDYLIIDMPVGPTTKVKKQEDAKYIAEKFVMLGKRFGMKVKVQETHAFEPIGAGIGPALEARDVLRVLQQHKLRPLDLEEKGVLMAGELLELAGYCKNGQGKKIAEKQIKSGEAWKKMNEIIVAQGGKKNLKADEVVLGALRYEYHAQKSGKIIEVNNRAIVEICINLGAPDDKVGGVHLHVHYGDKVKKHDKLFTLYASSEERLKLGVAAIRKAEVFKIK